MKTATLYIDNTDIRLGNILYFLAYCLNMLRTNNIIVYTENKLFYDQRKLFKFDVIFGKPENFDLKFSDTKFEDILDAKNCDFKALQGQLNKDYLDGFRYKFDLSNVCVVNLRFGDYLKHNNSKVYKTANIRWLKTVIDKYEVANKYNVVFVADDWQVASKVAEYLKMNCPIVSNDPLLCFNLLLKAKFIIGACSTFSFAGCMLNYNDANMVVEYPYYQKNNPFGWSEYKDSGLYDSERIIKEEYDYDNPTAVVCTIIKNEHKSLEEWIRHNISIGFSKIYLFEDVGSLSHTDICSKYKEVVLQRIEDTSYEKYRGIYFGSWRQTAMMNMFLNEYRACADWVAFIDVDEFIIFNDGYDMRKLLCEFRNENGIYLYWKNFGANGFVRSQNGNTVDIYTKEGKITSFDITWAHKSIVNLTKPIELRMPSPHTINNGVNTIGLHTNGIICYKRARINHYVTKSFEDYVEQIFLRGDVSPGHRKLDFFFKINDDMEPMKDKMIGDLLNVGTYIPKTIHYFNFGRHELDEQELMCIENWKTHLPDYAISIWDETTYDIHKNRLTEWLYSTKNFELLTDYAMSDIMYHNGGLCLDKSIMLSEKSAANIEKGPFYVFGKPHVHGLPALNFIDKISLEWIGVQPFGSNFDLKAYICGMFDLFKVYATEGIQDFHGITIYPENSFTKD